MKNFFYIATPIVLLIGIIIWAVPPYEVRKERKESKYLTNEQIVEKTKYCEENGLITQVKYYGGIRDIKCYPDQENTDETGDTKIKKSNITTVEVNIPEDN